MGYSGISSKKGDNQESLWNVYWKRYELYEMQSKTTGCTGSISHRTLMRIHMFCHKTVWFLEIKFLVIS